MNESLVGRSLDDRYRVESLLGEGGHAATYLAEDLKLKRRVAIKIPRAEVLAAPGFRERFDREIAELIRLDHPAIMKVFDAAEVDGIPFAVFQYLSGGSLSERIEAAGGWMPTSGVWQWLPRVAEALDFIHGQGVVHRDVKPANILFDEHDHAFLADFGIVKALRGSGSRSLADTVIGSPPYMAPEVGASGERVGPATDQYCLGASVYHALSGQFPHEVTREVELVELLVAKATQPPRDLIEVAPYVSPLVHQGVMRAIHRDPSRRFPSCAAFVEAFAAAKDLPPAAWLGPRDEFILENPVGPMCLLDPDLEAESCADADREPAPAGPEAERRAGRSAPDPAAASHHWVEGAPSMESPSVPGRPRSRELAIEEEEGRRAGRSDATALRVGRLVLRLGLELGIAAPAMLAAWWISFVLYECGVPSVPAAAAWGFLPMFLARCVGSYRGAMGWMGTAVGMNFVGSEMGVGLVLVVLGGAVLGDRTAVRAWPGRGSRLSVARWLGLEARSPAGESRRSRLLATVAGGYVAYLVGHFLVGTCQPLVL